MFPNGAGIFGCREVPPFDCRKRDVAEAWDLLAALATKHRLLERDVIAVDLRVKDRLAVRLGSASAVKRRGEGRST